MRAYLKLLLVLIAGFSVQGASLHWTYKRSIGETIIWKNQKDKNLKASSRLKENKNILASLRNRSKIIKDFEETKKKALSLTGVKDWQAKEYQWQGKERLTITGNYKDRKGKPISFVEVHLFREGKHLTIVATHELGKEVPIHMVNDLVNSVAKAEAIP